MFWHRKLFDKKTRNKNLKNVRQCLNLQDKKVEKICLEEKSEDGIECWVRKAQVA